MSGMEFVKSLPNPPKVIFTTAYREYAVEGFQVDAADYLVKPISFAAFSKAVNKTKQRYFSQQELPVSIKHDEKFLFIKSEYKIVRIDLNDIKYIEGMRDYVRIHQANKKPVMALLNMGKIIEHLPDNIFMCVHRSYIVNLNRIHTIERNRILFDKDVYIPVSDQYKDDFQRFIDNNFLK
jgi:two-component system LytT family response regulator